MSRRPLLVVLTAAAVGLAACGAAETTVSEPAGAPASTETTTDAPSPAVTETASPASEEPTPTGDATTAVPTVTEDTAPATPTPEPDEGTGAVQPVTLAFDGREVPVATACTGADGAVLATTEGEVTISLVREEGVALRYQAEGMTAETDEVDVEGGTDTTTYRATLSSDQVEPLAVTMVVMDDAMAALDAC